MSEKEQWKEIGGLPYEVSSEGRVRRTEALGGLPVGHVLYQQTGPRGYVQVTFRPYVHTLVAKAFHGPRPPGLVVNHKDGDKTNNRADNLEWVTHSENQDHALRTGLSPARGETHGRAKLTDKQVCEIRERYTGEWGQQTRLAEEYGVSQMLISQIVRGAIWTHLDPEYKPKLANRPRMFHGLVKLNETQVRELRKRSKAGDSDESLAADYGVKRQTIRDIVRGKTWRHLLDEDRGRGDKPSTRRITEERR